VVVAYIKALTQHLNSGN